jgi:hypothetical protein
VAASEKRDVAHQPAAQWTRSRKRARGMGPASDVGPSGAGKIDGGWR